MHHITLPAWVPPGACRVPPSATDHDHTTSFATSLYETTGAMKPPKSVARESATERITDVVLNPVQQPQRSLLLPSVPTVPPPSAPAVSLDVDLLGTPTSSTLPPPTPAPSTQPPPAEPTDGVRNAVQQPQRSLLLPSVLTAPPPSAPAISPDFDLLGTPASSTLPPPTPAPSAQPPPAAPTVTRPSAMVNHTAPDIDDRLTEMLVDTTAEPARLQTQNTGASVGATTAAQGSRGAP
eukprot:COSAG03_NODE_571_length_6898_cov_13.957641_5_plen_236_part_01